MPIHGVNGPDTTARIQTAQANRQADDTKADADRRRGEAENKRAAQQQQESNRGQGMNVTA